MFSKFTRNLLLLLGVLYMNTTTAQTIFYESFDGISGSTAGGAGTYSFPSGWLLANVDNLTINASVGYINEAWERRENFTLDVLDSVAFSTSYYSPAGTSNDWMWTPAINLTGVGAKRLSWNAAAYDPAYRDGYEVRIMTVPPTGGNGVIGNMLTSSTILFSTLAESTTLTERSVDISAYNGGTVYIGFRNNSTDKFILVIDDVKVENVVNYDARITDATNYEYTKIPKNQINILPLSAEVQNDGVLNLTNVNISAKVYNASNAMVYQASGTSVASLAPTTKVTINVPGWVPSASDNADNYRIEYTATMNESDLFPANDTMKRNIQVTDSIYARDNEDIIGNVGIGSGTGGYLGQSFTIENPIYLSSVSMYFTAGTVGEQYAAVIWNTDVTGKPNAIIASTDTLLYGATTAFEATIPIHGGYFLLNPGTYVVTAVEFTATISLANTSAIFTPGTVWFDWPGSSTGWANTETIGPAYAHPFYLRLNISEAAVLPVRIINFSGAITHSGNQLQWEVAEQMGIQAYIIERSMDAVHFEAIDTMVANEQPTYLYSYVDVGRNGIYFYRLKIKENDRYSYSETIRLGQTEKLAVNIFPNPAKQKATISNMDGRLLNSDAVIINAAGKVVKNIRINELPYTIHLQELSAGVYFIRFQDNTVLKLIKE